MPPAPCSERKKKRINNNIVMDVSVCFQHFSRIQAPELRTAYVHVYSGWKK